MASLEPINPDSRPLITITEDGDKLVTARLYSRESLDDLFEHCSLVLIQGIDEKSLLGQSITVCYQPLNTSGRQCERYFHGYCRAVRQVGLLSSRDYLQYEMIMVSWPWFLKQRTNCRVFQQQKISEIITTLAREHGFQSDLEFKISNDQRREYCVQFNESDWDFIQRLVVAQGWFYFFRQQQGQHTLIIGDNNRLFTDCGESGIEYFVGSHKLERAITEWNHGYQIQSGSVVTADYNYELAQSMLTDAVKTQFSSTRRRRLQQYFYPGGFRIRNRESVFPHKP